MRPTRITLTDFRSHTSTDLSLEGVHVASITGANGAGKSSILDAMLWAAHGADAIGLGRRTDAVIREGATEAVVALTFELAGERYRITRTRRLSGKSLLDLARRDGDTWTSLSRETITATQAAIEDLIGSMDTLLRSSFVPQGAAALFARATPAERKATLVDALDLGQYPDLAKQAADRARVQSVHLDGADRRISELAAQLAAYDVPTLETQLDQARADVASCAERRPVLVTALDAARKAVEDARIAAASTDAARQRVTDLEKRVQTLTSDATRAAQTERQRKRELDEAREAFDAVTKIRNQQPALVDVAPLEDRARVTGDALTTARAAVEAANHRRAALTGAHLRRTETQSAAEALETERTAAQQRLAALDAEQATCPTCAQELGREARSAAINALTTQLDELAARVRAAHQVAADVSRDVETLEAEIALDHAVIEAERAAVADAAAAAEALRVATANNALHHQIEARIAAARAAADREPQLHADWTAAVHAETLAKDALRAATVELEQARANLATDDAHARIQTLTEEVQAASLRVTELDARQADAERAIAQAETSLAHARATREALDTARAQREPIEAQLERWNAIAHAFGRDGIPKKVIRHACPQIEHDTNDLLARFAAPYRVRLDLERDTKAGTVTDTLDITILAGEHERPFDVLSGGEQYRVALALRIAIARVLAHRAGRAINLLVLDEPEGLDASGFSALTDVVRALSREFGLVLTVSHSDGLDAVCDTQIRVEKDADGSRVTVAA